MPTSKIILVLGTCGVLAACGGTLGEQALFGGATGAGVAAATDGDVVQGAAVGAGANVLACQTDVADCD